MEPRSMAGLAGFWSKCRYRSHYRFVARQVTSRIDVSTWAVSASTASWTGSRCRSRASAIACWPTSMPTTTKSRAATRKRWSCSGVLVFRRHSAAQSSVQSIYPCKPHAPGFHPNSLESCKQRATHRYGIAAFLFKVQLLASALGVLDGGGCICDFLVAGNVVVIIVKVFLSVVKLFNVVRS